MADAAAEISPALIGTEFEPRQVSWTSKDVMLYALGVGGSGGRHPGRQDGTVSGQGCLRAMSDFLTTFGGQAVGDGRWEFELHKRFNGAFGGTNGGVLSSLSVFAARSATERQPTSIDSRYLRGFRPGRARLEVSPLSEGRTVSVVAIAILDDHDRLCTHSTVTLVAADALARELSVEVQPDAPEGQASLADGKRWPQPKGMEIPLIDTFEPTAVGGQGHETTTATRVIWQEANTSAEACCIAADISVGPPVARAVRGAASTPNPDLSLRFLSVAEPGDYLAAQCRLAGIVAGVATTRINVWQGGELLAIGISTTTCLPMAR